MPNENPASLGTFEFSLRFPGQYFDGETNLAYNMLRDYSSGKYPGETHMQVGNDLLRLDSSGNFRSLYPVK